MCSGLRASSRVSLPTLLKDTVPSNVLITHQQLSGRDGFGSIFLRRQVDFVLGVFRENNSLLLFLPWRFLDISVTKAPQIPEV